MSGRSWQALLVDMEHREKMTEKPVVVPTYAGAMVNGEIVGSVR